MAFSTNQQIFEAVEKSKDILVTFNKDYSGDNIGGAIALLLFLKKTGKKVDVVCDNFRLPAGYTFLPQIKEIKGEINNLRKFIISLDISRTKVDEISYDVKEKELDFIVSPRNGFFEESDLSTKSSGFKYDLIFTLGTPDLEMLGKIYDQDTEFFYKTPIINIDHNPSNENFGEINLISMTASSTCEILFNLLADYNAEMFDEDIATALLTGVITATRNFKSNKVTPTTLNTASRLITAGARRSEIIQHLYQARSLATLKLWGRTLAHLKNNPALKLVWSLVRRKDFVVTGAKEENLDDVVEELIANSYEVETVVIIYEKKNGYNEISAKSEVGDDSKNPLLSNPASSTSPEHALSEIKGEDIGSVSISPRNYKIENSLKNGNLQNNQQTNPEEQPSKICVLIVSLKNINSLELAKKFHGVTGGDTKAKFCLTGLTLEEAETKVINEVKERLDEIKSKE